MTSGRPYLYRKKILLEHTQHEPRADFTNQQSNRRPIVYPGELLPNDKPDRVLTQIEIVRVPYKNNKYRNCSRC
jgi:hypothetical protein